MWHKPHFSTPSSTFLNLPVGNLVSHLKSHQERKRKKLTREPLRHQYQNGKDPKWCKSTTSPTYSSRSLIGKKRPSLKGLWSGTWKLSSALCPESLTTMAWKNDLPICKSSYKLLRIYRIVLHGKSRTSGQILRLLKRKKPSNKRMPSHRSAAQKSLIYWSQIAAILIRTVSLGARQQRKIFSAST